MFPEGTRNMSNEMLEFKKGAFHLALVGQLPILPVIISSYRGFLSHPHKVFNPGIDELLFTEFNNYLDILSN